MGRSHRRIAAALSPPPPSDSSALCPRVVAALSLSPSDSSALRLLVVAALSPSDSNALRPRMVAALRLCRSDSNALRPRMLAFLLTLSFRMAFFERTPLVVTTSEEPNANWYAQGFQCVLSRVSRFQVPRSGTVLCTARWTCSVLQFCCVFRNGPRWL